ncbi:hypothetical protein CRUP_034648 [Coryphaenoides rupestris]|nr:hypothetical protein CRUP_034648 [Coryphaenoides rupestris]
MPLRLTDRFRSSQRSVASVCRAAEDEEEEDEEEEEEEDEEEEKERKKRKGGKQQMRHKAAGAVIPRGPAVGTGADEDGTAADGLPGASETKVSMSPLPPPPCLHPLLAAAGPEAQGAAVAHGGRIQPAGRVEAVVGEALAGRGAQQLQEGELHHVDGDAVRTGVGELGATTITTTTITTITPTTSSNTTTTTSTTAACLPACLPSICGFSRYSSLQVRAGLWYVPMGFRRPSTSTLMEDREANTSGMPCCWPACPSPPSPPSPPSASFVVVVVPGSAMGWSPWIHSPSSSAPLFSLRLLHTSERGAMPTAARPWWWENVGGRGGEERDGERRRGEGMKEERGYGRTKDIGRRGERRREGEDRSGGGEWRARGGEER